jgi:hypothetical protein
MLDPAPAARMMLRVSIPAGVQKIRIQMIGDTLWSGNSFSHKPHNPYYNADKGQ